MKRFFQYILAATLLGGTVSLASCDDDEDTLNEWNMTYVSLLQADYLRPIPTFNLKHVLDEPIEGEISVSVVAAIQKPASQDIKVSLNASCEGIAAEKIANSSAVATIKAGETKSEPIEVSITDMSDFESVVESKTYSLKLAIGQIDCNLPEVTNSRFNQSISVTINKSEAKPENLIFGTEPEDSELHANVTDWTFKFMDGVENIGSNSVAGTGTADVATNGVPFWFTVDFKSPKTVTGIKTQHWGGGFAPSVIEIFVSEDGNQWKSMGEVATRGAQQIVSFKRPMTVQYLKYQMVSVPWRVDVTRFQVYMKK